MHAGASMQMCHLYQSLSTCKWMLPCELGACCTLTPYGMPMAALSTSLACPPNQCPVDINAEEGRKPCLCLGPAHARCLGNVPQLL